MKLLIVDDSLVMRKILERFLSGERFNLVGTASNGKEALKIFKETLPDLVTLDISMPRMNGLTCLEEMLKIKSDTKIIMVTSQIDKFTYKEAMEKGAAGVLGKPFNPEQILAKVNEIIGEKCP